MRLVRNERNILLGSVVALLAIFLAGSTTNVNGYPMMLEIDEEEERCIRLNIPEDDDAHMVFVVIPSEEFQDHESGEPKYHKNYKALESHFVGQMEELTKRRTTNEALIRKFPTKPPPEVQTSMDDFLRPFEGVLKTGVSVTLTNPKSTNARTMDTFWFTPLVVNHVRRAIRTQKKDREASPLEGYSACFHNEHYDPVHVVVDSVMVSDGPEYDDDDGADEDPTFQGHHLTPLVRQLEESVRAARTVINEMQYMEKREARMRHTADSINKRVRNFSYISIVILLVVTYLQVSYLKRYFRKKKLL